MISPVEFGQLLDRLGTRTTAKSARLEAIDLHDSIRKKSGRHAADTALRSHITRQEWNQKKNSLIAMAEKLPDLSAQNRIKKIVEEGDEEQITKLAEQLNTKIIMDSVRAAGLNEEKIRLLAAPYTTHQNPNGHLRARRWMRRQAKQATARLNLSLGLIGKNGYPHCSPFEIELRNQQKRRHTKFAEQTELTCEGKIISMCDVMNSAHQKRVAELYTWMKGLEKYAKNQGLTPVFITLTAPPHMHPNPSEGRNSWDGTEPDEAHKWIHLAFRRTEARLRKNDIIISGLRVVEPHQDSCPHWHVLFFIHESDTRECESIFRQQSEWQSEAGMKWMEIDSEKGSASSYIFKYITKALGSTQELEGEHASTDAWRSTWGIRSLQWIGMPPAGLWRNLRKIPAPARASLKPHEMRISEEYQTEKEAETLLFDLIRQKKEKKQAFHDEIWQAAHRGDACEFIRLAGGLNLKRKDRPIHSTNQSAADKKIISILDRTHGEIIEFNFPKWQQQRATLESKTPLKTTTSKPENMKVAVIHSYPSKTKTDPTTPPPPPKTTPQPPWWRDELTKISPIFPQHPPLRTEFENFDVEFFRNQAATRLRADRERRARHALTH